MWLLQTILENKHYEDAQKQVFLNHCKYHNNQMTFQRENFCISYVLLCKISIVLQQNEFKLFGCHIIWIITMQVIEKYRYWSFVIINQ